MVLAFAHAVILVTATASQTTSRSGFPVRGLPAGRYGPRWLRSLRQQYFSSPLLRIGPKPLEFPLQHYDRDTFVYQPTGESAGGPSGLRFSIDTDRQADRVLIENLNIHGQGAFARVKTAAPRM
jgi:hypothetical protein